MTSCTHMYASFWDIILLHTLQSLYFSMMRKILILLLAKSTGIVNFTVCEMIERQILISIIYQFTNLDIYLDFDPFLSFSHSL